MVGLQRALAAAFLAALALSASANDASIRLERVSLYQLARLVLGELLHEPYVLDGSLISSEDVATVDVGDLNAARARALLEAILRARGFALEREAGVTVVKRLELPSEPESVFVYRPKFRSVAYLQGAVRSFVPKGRFAGVGSPVSAAVPGPAQAGSATVSPSGVVAGAQTYPPQSAISGVVPAQGAVLASQDVLVFEGVAAEVEKVQRLVAELDRPAREVVIRAYVFEVGSAASEGSAVSLAVSLLGGRLTASAQAATLPNAVGLRVGGIDVAYSVLQSDSRFRVVSSPTLRLKSGEHAKLSVGSEVPVLGAVSISSTGQPVQSVEYRSSGVILDLRAQVLEEAVQLDVHQQVSSFVATTTGVNASPTLLKRDLTTNLGLRTGEVIVMGGLDESRGADARAGLPGLLSWIGSKSREESRSELILLLEATVVNGG